MKLLVILLVLLSERLLMHKLADKRISWIHQIQTFFLDVSKKYKPFESQIMKTILMVFPIWAVVAGVYCVLYDDFGGIFRFILNLLIFYFCIGPINIFYPSDKEGLGVRHLVAAANAIFGPIFWYVLFGPIFLLAYRLIDLASYHKKEQVFCKLITQFIDWIPVRITALCYLFVGNFQRGLEPFGNYFFTKPKDNDVLLESTAMASISEDQSTLSELEAEKTIEHSLVLILVFIAIITIIAWL